MGGGRNRGESNLVADFGQAFGNAANGAIRIEPIVIVFAEIVVGLLGLEDAIGDDQNLMRGGDDGLTPTAARPNTQKKPCLHRVFAQADCVKIRRNVRLPRLVRPVFCCPALS